MNRRISASSVLRFGVGILMTLPAFAFAQTNIPVPVTSVQQLYELFCNGANWFFAFVLVIAVIIILIAALKFYTAGGNEQKINSARDFLIYALVGVAIAVLVRSLVLVVGSLVGVSSGTNLFTCQGLS